MKVLVLTLQQFFKLLGLNEFILLSKPSIRQHVQWKEKKGFV